MNATADMREVTKEEFFAALYADKRDVMPTVEHPERTEWRDRNRNLFGRSFPGWRNPRDAKSWWLV